MAETRIERDLLGEREIPAAALYGIATLPRRRELPALRPPGPPRARARLRRREARLRANQCRAGIPARSDGGASRGGMPGDDAWRAR